MLLEAHVPWLGCVPGQEVLTRICLMPTSGFPMRTLGLSSPHTRLTGNDTSRGSGLSVLGSPG